MRLRLLPRSLAARTAWVLLAGLALVQVAGLTIHALDRLDLQRLAQARDIAVRVMGLYRAVILTPAADRDAMLHDMEMPPGLTATLSPGPPQFARFEPVGQPLQRLLRVNMNLSPVPAGMRPREIEFSRDPADGRVTVAMRTPDGSWLAVTTAIGGLRPWHSGGFLLAFLLMTAAAAALTIWAVRRLTAPVRILALAAESLGRDVNAPPLPESGPTEIATAAAAFNTMAARIRRFVQDRTEMLTAIGHDLRTPITRLKLRAEFMEDEEQRRKMLNDLEELEAMVSATLAFGRDAKTTEPVSALDLPELLRTVLDEAGDARPDSADRLSYAGPNQLTVRARPLALKRVFVNLIANAISYGGSARVRLEPPVDGAVSVFVEDDGPGIPPEHLDRVFEPFHRVEGSRNRETGGVGLGLPIARNILRAHGGDVTLANRPMGGVRAHVLLPA
ncbi:MAG: HAMP domain-containing protein [Acetobacteraceae bacterium]|nr:HAMP domain-containing protein [Acetobacteraceae bacterium]